VAVRTRAGGDQGATPIDAFIAAALDEVHTRANEGQPGTPSLAHN
jgi:hypothetical protein